MSQVQSHAIVSQMPSALPGRAYRLMSKIRAVADGTVVAFSRAGAGIREIDAVFARYDLRAISPRQIDALARELSDAGFRDKGFIAMLKRRGEVALARSRQEFAKIGYEVSGIDAQEKLDLLQLSMDQINLSTAFGQPTGSSELFSSELMRFEERKQRNKPEGTPVFVHDDVLLLSPAQRV